MSFLPENYEAPQTGGGSYFKPADGPNRIRVAGGAIVGWVAWDRSGDRPAPKRGRVLGEVKKFASDEEKPRFFWAFPIIDRNDGNRAKIWEVTQVTIQSQIEALVRNSDWGNPKEYDLTITKSGAGKDTTYTITPSPKTPIDITSAEQAKVDGMYLDALYEGGDPFTSPEPVGQGNLEDTF